MKPDDAPPQGESIPVDLDVVDAGNGPAILYVVSYAHAMDKFSNAELRAMGIMNFPGRTPGLPDE